MKKTFLVIGAAAFIVAAFPPERVFAACDDKVTLYAQDFKNLTPGEDNDTAIIKDRDGGRLAVVPQREDKSVIWPATVYVAVRQGERLRYTGDGSDDVLKFDIVDTTYALLERVVYRGVAHATKDIAANGFIRFNQGDSAHQRNRLALCLQEAAPANRAPVWTQESAKTLTAGQTLQFAVAAIDADGDALAYSIITLPAGASFDAGTRLFSWTPTAGQTGAHAAIFRVSDGKANADMSVQITVTSAGGGATTANRPPVWSALGTQTIRADQTLQFFVTASDPDGDSLTYSAFGLPSGASFDASLRRFTWTPAASQLGTYVITFRASDGTNVADMAAPVVVSAASGGTGTPAAATYAGVVTNPYFYGPGPAYDYGQYQTPSPYGSYYGSYYGYNYSGYAPTYQPTYNSPPVWTPTSAQTVVAGQILHFGVSADDPNRNALTYTVLNLPTGASFDPTTRTFHWVPTTSQVGGWIVTFRVFDGTTSVDMSVPITVLVAQPAATAQPPIYTPPAPTAVTRTVVVREPAAEEPLRLTNLRVEADGEGRVVISWDTNKAARGRVIYDVVSEPDRTNRVYTYARATPDGTDYATHHEVRLSDVEFNVVYYFRAVAKTNGETATSREIAFVKLPGGGISVTGTLAGGAFATTTAEVSGIFGRLFGRSWFWPILIILVVLAVIYGVIRMRKT